MTAQIIRLARDMPQELSRADLDAATDAHVAELRRDMLLALRTDWAANRLTQQQVLDADIAAQMQRENRITIRYIAAALIAIAVAFAIGHATQSAMTASIAADLAR